MSIQIATPFKENKPWTKLDVASTFATFAIIYALSPPWIIALARVFNSPTFVQDAIAFIYHPLAVARYHVPAIDNFYNAYRVMLAPWLTGI